MALCSQFLALIYLCTFVSRVLPQAGAPSIIRRFQYKYSFKGPQLASRDGQVPYWYVEGDAIAGDDSIRLAPSLKSKRGRAICKSEVNFKNWEVETAFRVTGRGRLGADGLALWFTSAPIHDGTVFGAADRWQGLGLFFDSYDNDGLQNNPIVMGIVNDGTKEYDHRNDGGRQAVGQCIRDFRNKPHPVRIRITYLDNTLTVYLHQGLTWDMKNPNAGFELCFRADNVYLPTPGRFGLSAATGGLADDHDVLAFIVHELAKNDGSAPPSDAGAIPEDERARLSQKYDQMTEEVEKMRQDYKKEHPDKKHDDYDEDDGPEDWAQRELRNIYQSQSVLLRTIQTVDRKLDEMYGRQEQLARQVYAMSQNNQQALPQQQGGGQPNVPSHGGMGSQDGMKRHEVDQLLNFQRELMNELSQLKSTVMSVSQAQQQIHMAQQQMPQGGGAGGSAAAAQANAHLTSGIVELRDHLAGVRRVVDQLAARPMPSAPSAAPIACPVPNCLTPIYFIVFMIVQFCLFVGFIFFKSRNEKPKFY